MIWNRTQGKQEYRLYSYLSSLFDDIKINKFIIELDVALTEEVLFLSLTMIKTKLYHIIFLDQIKNKDHKIYSKKKYRIQDKNVLEDLDKEFVSKLKIVMIEYG